MTAIPQQLEAYAQLSWAKPFLTSKDWVTCDRTRGSEPGEDTDRFCRDTMQAHDGVLQWLELYEKPALDQKVVRSLSLCQLGAGLIGFPGIAQGGALLTLVDEALGYVMVANEQLEHGVEFTKPGEDVWKTLHASGGSPQDILKGRFLTAGLKVKFLKPVVCPGVIGIEVEVLEHTTNKMKTRGVMKDVEGIPLLQVDGLWIRLDAAPKL